MNNRDLPGNPDLANRTRRFAVFVHGCFWHRHEGCPAASVPKSNVSFWKNKFARNVERDRAVTRALDALGYRVLWIWECETKDENQLRERMRMQLPPRR